MQRGVVWPKVKLGDHIDLLTGFPFKSKRFTDDPSDIALLRGYNVVQGAIRWENMKRWPASEVDDFSKYALRPDDIVLAMDRPWIEAGLKFAWITERDCPMLLVQRVARLRGTEALSTEFLRYIIADQSFAEYLQRIVTGVSVPHISATQIKSFEFGLPPLPIQRKIAAILSAYDDLIENNTRRIAVLEEMAQLLYREWFVHFRFPGHEQVAMVESELGPIPEGWEVKQLEEVCHLVIGQSPKSEFYNEEGEGLPFHQGVKDFGDFFPTTRVYCTVTKRVAEAGDILFSVRAPVGRMNIADRRTVIGRGLHAIRSKTGNQVFVFLQLKDKFYEEDIMGGGTIFKSVTKADMLGLELLIPSTDVMAQFEHIVNPMFSALKVLTAKNANLRRTRDLLLPRLISGEIDVSDLDIAVPLPPL